MRYLLVLFLLLFATGCATVEYMPNDIVTPAVPGVYHEVRRGETLWYISRLYNVNLEKLTKANYLPNASNLEVGQLIFIPEGSASKRQAISSGSKKLESFIWPLKGEVASYFGSQKQMAKNKGIDIKGYDGASVLASRSGRVMFASANLKGYGKTIIIDHLDGFQTVYAHNSENLVTVEQRVSQGQVIAKVGRTGRVDTPTLHFEIRKEHKPQNPFYYLP